MQIRICPAPRRVCQQEQARNLPGRINNAILCAYEPFARGLTYSHIAKFRGTALRQFSAVDRCASSSARHEDSKQIRFRREEKALWRRSKPQTAPAARLDRAIADSCVRNWPTGRSALFARIRGILPVCSAERPYEEGRSDPKSSWWTSRFPEWPDRGRSYPRSN